MCTFNNVNGSSVSAEPVPPEALAAAVVLIALGIVLIIMYGQSQKQAWSPQHTFAFTSDITDGATLSNQCGTVDTVMMVPDDYGGPDGVTGLDTTLETQLIYSRTSSHSPSSTGN